ncbi:SGNH/GDSL hydrolase family protein [Thermomonas aquatica]|uniref:SGNH/GDSL hydrolase family protein n=1 Tax=Thermomonas aquatica TaxID=2202149 RepID=A0A5B7ZPC9_9GAMM|nr:SGNH/GDSL hydrolase family protein [Thermomonas aquatica]QDA56880.1 SGNH/GDSL hydrolase family protein [Thermomonas aquatica]
MSLRPILMLACLAWIGAPLARAQSVAPAREYRVLLVGNSLIYTNNLPALLRAVGASQGTPIATETYASPGGTLAERWKQGHVAEALRKQAFDAVILQEQGGNLAACMASPEQQATAPCMASIRAQVGIAKLAQLQHAKVMLFATWGPDQRWQGRLDRSTRLLAGKSMASVFDAAAALRALHKAQPGIDLYPDGTHPSTQASLMLALALYRDITGTPPLAKDLRITAPLLPVNAAISAASPMESQPGLAGDGKATLVPASLIEPLVKALPEPDASGEMDPARPRR